MSTYIKKSPMIGLSEFLNLARQVQAFTSSRGKRYQVIGYDAMTLLFMRLDASSDRLWDMDLLKVYEAYQELDRFDTEAFRAYVPRRHSPARGLLLHLELLVEG